MLTWYKIYVPADDKSSPLSTFLPLFFIGVLLCDIEHLKEGYRPLDSIRNLPLVWKILLNTVLLTIFVIYGSWKAYYCCYTYYDGECPLWEYATFHKRVYPFVAFYLASVSIIILALTSEACQWVLSTWIMQFLGRISYTLFLVHNLIV